MTVPFYTDDWLTLYGGDCREVLASLPSDSVDCVVTSPPYWGLRDYGQDGQLGLERTPEEYVANMVTVFREVRRVLKPSGTCWLNLGDSFADKQLVGIPWRVAFALQADGWYLRSDVIWSKPNPMPESVTDRPTKSHEYLFLLTKSARYYFDADAVREGFAETTLREYGDGRLSVKTAKHKDEFGHGGLTEAIPNPAGRNIRSVWTIATRPYPGAHFAVFPPELPERCIKAGSSEKGVCPECGAPWERVVQREGGERYATGKSAAKNGVGLATAFSGYTDGSSAPTFTTLGWRDACRCAIADPVPAVILDPFGGSGTVGMVANRLSRRAILVDLNPEYLQQQMKRNAQTPLGLAT